MRVLTKKLPVAHGVELTLQELIEAACGIVVYVDDQPVEIFESDDEVTITHGGKKIDPKTIKIQVINDDFSEVL